MLNPNISKLVYCIVGEPVYSQYSKQVVAQHAEYRGVKLDISENVAVKPGRRRLYLKYSILRDQYYLTKRK